VLSKQSSFTARLLTPCPPRQRLALLALVALFARAITFGNPITHADEQFYFAFARAWVHGAMPYVDIWDRKPIGLFLVYLPAAWFGNNLGIWAYQAMALASLVATAFLITRLADRAGWGQGALAGAIAYILWVDFIDGQGGQAPIFYNLLIAGAAVLIAPREDDRAPRGGDRTRLAPGVAAMALVGLALQIKYSVVFEGMFFGLWLLWREWQAGRRLAILPIGAGLVAVALVPTVAAWLAFSASGAGDAWFYANVTSILERKADPISESVGNLLIIILITSPLVSAAILAWRCGEDRVATARSMRRWLFAWLGSAALGLLVFGTWFEHYALPLLVPAACCASGFFGCRPSGRRVVLGLLVLLFVGGQITLLVKRHNRGTPAQFAALVEAIGHGRGCLYVYSGESMLYPASGRCALTRYQFPSHLSRMREAGAIGVDQRTEIERVIAQRPEIVVTGPAYRGERPEIRAVFMESIRRNYRLMATRQLGNQMIEIYQLR
jgi:hypothetical protein